MMCENCGQRRAEIHLVQVINGVRIEENICRQCAEKMMPAMGADRALKMSLSLEGIMGAGDVLKNLLFPMLPELYEIEYREMKCPHCGKEIEPGELFGKHEDKAHDDAFDFSRAEGETGSARKASCEGGTAQVQAVVPEIKIESRPERTEPEKELANLTRELELVLRAEKYERAAEIRDRVAELQKIISEKSKEA